MTWWTAIDTESVSDSGSSNTVLIVSLALVLFGVALLAVTVWFWRVTRPDPDALGPLAVMSDRDFFRRGPIEQRRSLDVARPGVMTIDEPVSAVEPQAIPVVESDEQHAGAVVEIADETIDEHFDDDEFDSDELDEHFSDAEPEPIIVDDVESVDVEESVDLVESDDDPSPPSRPRSIDPLL